MGKTYHDIQIIQHSFFFLSVEGAAPEQNNKYTSFHISFYLLGRRVMASGCYCTPSVLESYCDFPRTLTPVVIKTLSPRALFHQN